MILIFLLTIIIHTLSPKTFGVEMESSLYRIQEDEVSISSTETKGKKNRINIVGEKYASDFNSEGFVFKSPSTEDQNEFKMLLSDSSITWEKFTPHAPSKGSLILTIRYKGDRRFHVFTSEESRLASLLENVIPDTRCEKTNPCDEQNAQVWSNTASYGFGYNVKGVNAGSDFRNDAYFRPFPDQSDGENPVGIIRNYSLSGDTKNSINASKSTITFQVITSDTFSRETYNTVVHFLALPNF